MKIAIGIRTCNSSLNYWNSERIIDVNKSTLILTCINSLLKSAKKSNNEIVFSIHDDNSDEDFLNKLDKLFKTYNFNYGLFHTEKLKNFASQYDWCKKQKCDFVYCVEDDYLHTEDCLDDMVDVCVMMTQFWPGVYAVFPFNCAHRYMSPQNLEQSYLIKGTKQYWRSVNQSTHSFFVSKKTFDAYDDIMKYQAYNWPDKYAMEHHTINQVWQGGQVRLLCPVNSLAIHMADKSQEEPFLDWKQLWNKNLIEG